MVMIISSGETVQGTGGGGGAFLSPRQHFCSSESWMIQCDNTPRGAVSSHDES